MSAGSGASEAVRNTRALFVLQWGEEWTLAWEHTGFPNRSTALPNTQAERKVLLGSLAQLFTDMPELEVNTPRLQVTAARAAALDAALSATRTAQTEANVDASQRKEVRDAAVEALRSRMRKVVAELGQLLADDAAEWVAFGLVRPSAPSTPEPVEELRVTPGLPGQLRVEWLAGVRGERFRVWLKIIGVDAEFRPVATVYDRHATIFDLVTGQTVAVQVTAANEAGECPPCAPVSVVVG